MLPHKKGNIKRWLTNKKNWKRSLGPILFFVAIFAAGRIIDLNYYVTIAQNWVGQFGPWGPAVFIGLYVAATMFFLPGLPFTLVSALIFGSVRGFLIMVVATSLAAVIAFLAARYLARARLQRRISNFGSFGRVKNLIEKNQWLAITFIRLMPIFPFSVNNYGLGLTDVPFWHYLLFSEIVFIPMNAVWVFGTSTLFTAMTRGEVSWAIMGGATASGLLVLMLGYIGKRAFGKHVDPSDSEK